LGGDLGNFRVGHSSFALVDPNATDFNGLANVALA
jgi:hypothetical protein